MLPTSGSVIIGRAAECDIRVDDASVSRRHAVLRIGAELFVEDLGSANGIRLRAPAAGSPHTAQLTEIKGTPGHPLPLRIGDTVSLGAAMLVVRRTEGRAPVAAEDGFIVRDEAMRKVHDLAARVAQGNISVLLLGETGAGKEVLAEAVHRRSPRRAAPFLRLNCAALSETLLESELFGHEKGAFTGATQAKPGLLETADGGTVFLDEVGEISAAIQVKLLRVLEERKVTRVGALTARAIDVRFVSATNRDLEAEVKRGTFRQDLYFRLGGIPLVIPPLRERRGEIEPLAHLFAGRAASQLGRPAPRIAPSALAVLEAYAWPGNVRELRNVMERAVVLAETDEITPDHLLLAGSRPASEAPAAAPEPAATATADLAAPARAALASGAGLRAELDALERQRILDALSAAAGNQTQAAAALGMSRRTFIARLDEYGIPRPRKR
ncbi:Response regulator of zinc sigma-54-dependent two-component system [Minicystis rosea]|nr:Response regulator of zinc sigma-54-dependent two-component system [Minicystis rosea]